jgi:hypothetical protein
MNKPVWPLWSSGLNERAARCGFPPLQRAQIVQLVCLEPVAKGLHITHCRTPDMLFLSLGKYVKISTEIGE